MIVPGMLIGLLAGCNPGGENPGQPSDAVATAVESSPLRLAAATDLQRVLPRLAERFEAKTGAKPTLIFDASGRLAEQIKAGAPFDVFLAANQKFVRDLADAGLVLPDSVRPYARGSLVLCVHPSVKIEVRELADLGRAEIRKIAIANPEYAPYGAAARQALERAGLWSQLEPKIVRAASVRQAMQYIENGDAEVGLVSRSLLDKVDLRPRPVDPSIYDPLVQAMGIVAETRQPDRARAFLDFVMGEEGQAILHDAGFQPGESSTEAGPKAARPAGPLGP
jgi:molybdate transport system substrate-binding protein